MRVTAWPHGDPNRVVRDVLAGPDFRSIAATTSVKPHATIWEIAWNWFVQHVLHPIFGPIAKAIGASQGVGTAIGMMLVAIALAALAFAIYRFVLAFVRPATARRGVAPSMHALATERGVAEWRALARDAAARGDYARAIAALFAAALVALDERAVVTFDPARTPGEYRRLVRRSGVDAAASFDELAERFVLAAYARGAVGPSDFAAAERAFAAFEPVVAA